MSARPFRCLVNLTELDPPANGGVSRVAWEVSALLAEAASDRLRPVFLVRWGFAAEFTGWLGQPAVVVPAFTTLDARAAARALRPDLIVSPLFGLTPLARSPVSQVTQIPDTLVFDHPELFGPRDAQGRRAVYAALPAARQVVTISEWSRRQLLRHTALRPEQITVVGLGSDLELAPALPGLPERFVIYPARWWPHKRHDLLLRIMQRVWAREPALRLVLPGGWSDADRAALQQSLAKLGIVPEQVVLPGYVSDGQLRAIYARAEAMIFPSVYEGFGMPVVEALAAGCPVLCAPVAALPEVAGDAPLYVDSDDPAEWDSALLDRLPGERADRVARGRAQAARWTWDAARAGWRRVLEAAGVPFGEASPGPPLLSDSSTLTHLDAIRLQLGADWHSDRDALRAVPRLLPHPRTVWRVLRLSRELLKRAQSYMN